jgi:hypothetical protein
MASAGSPASGARARSSAVEHTLHTGGVTGSIPVAPTRIRQIEQPPIADSRNAPGPPEAPGKHRFRGSGGRRQIVKPTPSDAMAIQFSTSCPRRRATAYVTHTSIQLGLSRLRCRCCPSHGMCWEAGTLRPSKRADRSRRRFPSAVCNSGTSAGVVIDSLNSNPKLPHPGGTDDRVSVKSRLNPCQSPSRLSKTMRCTPHPASSTCARRGTLLGRTVAALPQCLTIR